MFVPVAIQLTDLLCLMKFNKIPKRKDRRKDNRRDMKEDKEYSTFIKTGRANFTHRTPLHMI